MLGNPLCQRPGNDAGEVFHAGLSHLGHAAESPQQLLRCALADAGNLVELSGDRAFRTALAVKTYGEAVSFVANLLYEVQERRMPGQADGLIFLAEHK